MDFEHIVIQILREAAFRHFVDHPLIAPAQIVRFLRASQRYI